MKALIVRHNKAEILEHGTRLAPRRKARQVRREERIILKQFIDRYYPTFAALASLREIFRVSVALKPQPTPSLGIGSEFR